MYFYKTPEPNMVPSFFNPYYLIQPLILVLTLSSCLPDSQTLGSDSQIASDVAITETGAPQTETTTTQTNDIDHAGAAVPSQPVLLSDTTAPEGYDFAQFRYIEVRLDVPYIAQQFDGDYIFIKVYDADMNTYWLSVQQSAQTILAELCIPITVSQVTVEIYDETPENDAYMSEVQL